MTLPFDLDLGWIVTIIEASSDVPPRNRQAKFHQIPSCGSRVFMSAKEHTYAQNTHTQTGAAKIRIPVPRQWTVIRKGI